MLDWLHDAIDWMGSILLFIILCAIWSGVIYVVIDELLDVIFPSRVPPPRTTEQEENEY